MPLLVQSANSTGNTVTVTLGSNTTAGNCLVASIALGHAGGLATVSSVTLGGAADNWAQLKAVGDLTTGAEQLASWADPSCAGGQTSVVMTPTVADTNCMIVDEFSGIVASSVLDQSATFDSLGGTNSTFSVTSGATSQASEVAVGCVYGFNSTITGPASPWVNTATVVNNTRNLQRGYDILSSTGTVTYSGSFGGATFNGQILVTLKGTAAAGVGSPVQPRVTVPRPKLRRASVITLRLVPTAGPVLTAQLPVIPRPRLRPRGLVVVPRSLLASPPPVTPGKPVLAAPGPQRQRPRGRAMVMLPRPLLTSPAQPPVVVRGQPPQAPDDKPHLKKLLLLLE